MKNTVATDPLKENESEEKREEKRKKDTLKEEHDKKTEPPVKEPDQVTIEVQAKPARKATAKPSEEIPDQLPEEHISSTEPSPEPLTAESSDSATESSDSDETATSPQLPELTEPKEPKEPKESKEPTEPIEPSESAEPLHAVPGPDPDTQELNSSITKILIDDQEEQQNNEFYEDDLDRDDHQEEEPGETEEERINYFLLSKEDLVKLLSDRLDNPGKGNIRQEVKDIKQAFFEKQNSLLEEKKQHFLEEGGNLEDFKPADDPLETEMKELLNKFRGLKAEYTKQLEKTKQENLVKKQEILEALRVLMEGQESFEITFRKFKDLQRQWFGAGIVPQQNLKDLWDSYNYFVDKFNDYVRINRELRALDLKKNLELKIQLCERTEELENEPNIVQAFKSLQKFHTRWREIGPVPRDSRDEIWERFKQATSQINRKHQDYHSKLKESLQENLDKKRALCEKVEFIATKNYETHGAWVEKTNQVLEIQKTWKTIGYAPKKDNNAIYARFRKACDTFFAKKAGYYSAAFEEQKDNLVLKTEIVEKAEALSDNQNWKETTTELIQLQKQWKEIGPVPRRESDKLWRRFRAACDKFFNNKSRYFEDIDSTFDDNLKAKEALVKEMDNFLPGTDRKKNMKALEEFQTKFDAIGYVPSIKKDWIKDQFREAQDRLLEKIGMDESERSVFRFRNRIRGMVQAPRADMKLNFERDKLASKLQQLRNDIGVWENNIGFFKQSESSDETIQGFQEKIESAHERIRVLELKIRILDDMENEN